MLPHKCADLLAVNTLRLHCSRSRANKVAHRFMRLVRDPDRLPFSGPQKLGETYRIAPVGLDPVARLPRYQRGSCDAAWIPHARDETIETVTGESVFKAKMRAFVFTDNPLHHSSYCIRRSINFTEIPNLTPRTLSAIAMALRDFAASIPTKTSISLGSSSCDEDRLGHPEQPSEIQRRASHLKYRGGHTVLRCSHAVLDCCYHRWDA